MSRFINKKVILFITACALFIIAVVFIKNEGPGKRIELEGLLKDQNFRDVAKSINECLESKSSRKVDVNLRENILFRSNKWFSGLSCKKVGNPEKIVTLNFDPNKNWEFFCRKEDGEDIVGYHVNESIEISNIEFMDTWKNAKQREAICGNLKVVLESVIANKKTLFHCEAGRDRTGAFAALIQAIILESSVSVLDDQLIKSIECDYIKSESLTTNKYGRMERFLKAAILQSGSVTNFITDKCEFNIGLIRNFSKAMRENT